MRSRCSTWTRSSAAARRSAISPVPSGELSSITSTCRSSSFELAERGDHRLEVLALVVRGQADEVLHGPYHREGGQDAPEERRRRRPVRPARGLPRARRRRPVPAARLSPRRAEDARDGRLDRAARGRRTGQGAVRDRQDDRGEDRPDRGGRADRGPGRSATSGSRRTSSSSCACPGSARRRPDASGRSSGLDGRGAASRPPSRSSCGR